MRQFEINGQTHLLEQVPVTNTVVGTSNYAQNLPDVDTFPSSKTAKVNALHNWSFTAPNRSNIAQGRHNVPLLFPGTSTPMLAGAAQLDAEFTHYLDYNWDYENNYYNRTWMFDESNQNDYEFEKSIRQQMSLNTCQGCHGGENKTLFTQMRPLGYGETAEYWKTIPDHQERFVDTRKEFVSNDGKTTIDVTIPIFKSNYSFVPLREKEYVTILSAFITGRSYFGAVGAGTFADDFVDGENGVDDSRDKYMTGLYFIMDPSNDGQDYVFGKKVPRKEKYYGFNELERRKEDLCRLINFNCRPGVLNILIAATQNMLNPEGH